MLLQLQLETLKTKVMQLRFQGPLLGKVILYILKNSSNHIIVFLDTLLLA